MVQKVVSIWRQLGQDNELLGKTESTWHAHGSAFRAKDAPFKSIAHPAFSAHLAFARSDILAIVTRWS